MFKKVSYKVSKSYCCGKLVADRWFNNINEAMENAYNYIIDKDTDPNAKVWVYEVTSGLFKSGYREICNWQVGEDFEEEEE